MLAEAGKCMISSRRLPSARCRPRSGSATTRVQRPSVCVPGPDGRLPLLSAALRGSLVETRQLLDGGAHVHIRAVDNTGATALHCAARSGCSKVVTALLRARAEVDAEDHKGMTPLAAASLGRNHDAVNVLLKAGARPDGTTGDTESLLLTACRRQDVGAVSELLGGRADPNKAGRSGLTALQLVAMDGHTELLRVLLRSGAEPDLVGSTASGLPLRLAAERGYAAVVQELLHAKADPNGTSEDGVTAEAAAASRAHTQVVHELILNGSVLSSPPQRRPHARCTGRARPGGLKFCVRAGALENDPGQPLAAISSAHELLVASA